MTEEKIESIIKDINKKIESVTDLNSLYALKTEYLGKKGIITELQSGIKDATDKKAYGMSLNKIKTEFNNKYEEKLNDINDRIYQMSLFDKSNNDISLWPETNFLPSNSTVLSLTPNMVAASLMSLSLILIAVFHAALPDMYVVDDAYAPTSNGAKSVSEE